MGRDVTSSARRAAIAAVVLIVGSALALVTSLAPAPSPWWHPAGFDGIDVTAVSASGTTVVVAVGGRLYRRADGSAAWIPASSGFAPATNGWTTVDGRPLNLRARDSSVHGAPHLTGAVHIAAPLALPGAAVAVGADSVVWRHTDQSGWERSLLLLPSTLGVSAPRVTDVVAFGDSAAAEVIYAATDGDGALLSTDAGLTWRRAAAGLPERVNALAAAGDAVWAATPDGLFVHRLQALPAPPDYADAQYWWRVAGIALVVLVSTVIAIVFLTRGPTGRAKSTV